MSICGSHRSGEGDRIRSDEGDRIRSDEGDRIRSDEGDRIRSGEGDLVLNIIFLFSLFRKQKRFSIFTPLKIYNGMPEGRLNRYSRV